MLVGEVKLAIKRSEMNLGLSSKKDSESCLVRTVTNDTE